MALLITYRETANELQKGRCEEFVRPERRFVIDGGALIGAG